MVVVESDPKQIVGGRSCWYSVTIKLQSRVRDSAASVLSLLSFKVKYETARPQRLNKTGMVTNPVTERNSAGHIFKN